MHITWLEYTSADKMGPWIALDTQKDLWPNKAKYHVSSTSKIILTLKKKNQYRPTDIQLII